MLRYVVHKLILSSSLFLKVRPCQGRT